MRATRLLLSAGTFALALVGWGVPLGLAWDNGTNGAVPAYPLPSDGVPDTGTVEVPYPLSSDPATGDLVSTPSPGVSNSWFLTFNGLGGGPRLDTPVSACSYYKTIGAVDDCKSDGTFVNPITFETWKQSVKLGKYATDGKTEDVAHFVNQVDLNLTRDHHMISYWSNQLAGYVCNHKGPQATLEDPTELYPTQHEIDRLIRTIRHNQNLVACVAMEFSPAVEYPGGSQPTGTAFTKFWIFGPNGDLLSTVDLDNRGPKGVPQVCTACHGGSFGFKTTTDSSTGTVQFEFDPTAAQPGDLGAHFLPFDIANFAFSSKLTDQETEDAIFRMNMNVYNSELTRVGSSQGSASIVQLIKGWYGDVTESNTSPHLNRDFIPSTWSSFSPVVYANAVAHSCRTCHTAMDNYPFEVDTTAFSQSAIQAYVCNGHEMPNSKVTFDRFWLSDQAGVPGQPAGIDDQVFALKGFLGVAAVCSPPP